MSAGLADAQRLQIGRVIRRTFTGVGQNLGPLVLLGLVFVTLPNLIGAYFAEVWGAGLPSQQLLYEAPANLPAIIFVGAGLWGVTNRFAGNPTPLKDWVTAGFRNFFGLFGLRFLTNLGVVVGLILLVAPGLIWLTAWSVSGPIKVAENETVVVAINRSMRLTRGHRWTILALYLLTGVAYLLISFLFGLLLGVARTLIQPLLNVDWSVHQLATFVIGPLMVALLEIFLVAGVSALYFELAGAKSTSASDSTAAVFD